MRDKCPKCARPKWNGLSHGAINIDECEFEGGISCTLTVKAMTLFAALNSVIKAPTDPATLRTAGAILEQIAPSRDCPMCGRPGAINPHRRQITMHYPTNEDIKPCVLSLKYLKNGELV